MPIKEIIDKAVEGGFKGKYLYDDMYENFYMIIDGSIIPVDDEKVIFSHDFLIAFHGEETYCLECDDKHGLCICDNTILLPAWQYFGFQQLKSEDRIKYLEGFLG